jgi:hypothetical protein
LVQRHEATDNKAIGGEREMNKETAIEALKELQQDYVDDRHYYTALQIAIEILESSK